MPIDPFPPGSGSGAGVRYDIEAAPYNAKPDAFYTDAVVPTGPSSKATVATQGCLAGTGTGTFTISSGTSYPTTSFSFAIDSEVIVGSISGTTVTVTQRGAQNTTPATHNVGAQMFECITTANPDFLTTDTGNNVVFLRTGDASFLDQHTTIRSVLSSTAITVNNRATRSPGVYGSNPGLGIRFYVSRNGDQLPAIQAAIDAAWLAGGGTVQGNGVGYAMNGAILGRNNVMLDGAGEGATMFHLLGTAGGAPGWRSDTTPQNSAGLCGLRSLRLDLNRDRQSTLTTSVTLQAGAAGYTAGATTVDVLSATPLFQGGGVLNVQTASGVNKVTYQDIQYGGGVAGSDRLTGLTGGNEGTTDANSNNATVTQITNVGVYSGMSPFNATPSAAEYYDPHFLFRDVHIKYAGGDGWQNWAQSESRCQNVWVDNTAEIGFRPSYDTWVESCTAEGCGRMGFLIRGSSCQGSDNKAFFSGGLVAADGHGFFFEGYTGLESGVKWWVNCNAQDNKASGFRIRNCQRIGLTGVADSNSTSSAGTYPGILMEGPGSAGTNGCCLMGILCTDRNTTATQTHGLKVADAGVQNNQIIFTHLPGTSGQSGFSTAIDPSSVLDGGNNILINGMGGQKVEAFAATPTFDPYAATTHVMSTTAGVTMSNAPSNGHHGCKLRLIFNFTGAFTVGTFNAVFKGQAASYTGANGQTLVLDYEQDNAGNWQLTSSRGPN